MNNTLRTLLFLFLIVNCRQIYSQQTSIENYNLNGKIKKVSYDSYLSKMTDKGLVKTKKGWEDTEKNDEIIVFNESGSIITVSYRDKDSKLVRTDKFDYDGNNLVKSTTKYQKSKYFYDNQNRLTNVKVFDRTPDNISASNIDEIDDKEKLIIKYDYDLKGRIKQRTKNNIKKGVQSTTTYIYNEKDLLIKEETISSDYKDWYLYQYDSNGKIVAKKWYDNDEGLLENEMSVYSKVDKISSTWENYSDGEIEGKITYKYENGNEKEVVEYDVLENTQIKWEYSYEYDSKKNWTKKIAHTFKGEYYIVNRKIEYY